MYDQPLAFGDGSHVSLETCIGVDHIRMQYVGESNYPLYQPGYRWYYLSEQTKDEVLIFKTHDSDTTKKAMCKSVPAGNRLSNVYVMLTVCDRLPTHVVPPDRCSRAVSPT